MECIRATVSSRADRTCRRHDARGDLHAVNSIDRSTSLPCESTSPGRGAARSGGGYRRSRRPGAPVSGAPLRPGCGAAGPAPPGATASPGAAASSSDEVAALVIAARITDSPEAIPYVPGTNPGDWRPTPPDFAPPASPNWGGVRPWTMSGRSIPPQRSPRLRDELGRSRRARVRVAFRRGKEARLSARQHAHAVPDGNGFLLGQRRSTGPSSRPAT